MTDASETQEQRKKRLARQRKQRWKARQKAGLKVVQVLVDEVNVGEKLVDAGALHPFSESPAEFRAALERYLNET